MRQIPVRQARILSTHSRSGVGTSGGAAGLARGCCLLIGGEGGVVEPLRPIVFSLAPGIEAATRTAGRKSDTGRAEEGMLHCGPHGAGHFVKMVHDGIECGVMAPLRNPELFRCEMNLPEIAAVWRRGSFIASCSTTRSRIASTRRPLKSLSA